MELDLVKEIVAEVLHMDPNDITPDKDFEKDLGADSLDRVEIIMNLEERLNVQIPDEDLEGIITVGDAAEKIKNMI